MTEHRQAPTKTVCFSDIDGTLVHYPTSKPGEPWRDEWGELTGPSVHPGLLIYTDKFGHRHKVLKLPPSTTGKQGIIGLKALSALSLIRADLNAIVLVTGARTATLLMRLPWLPIADAYVTENGGRIFYHEHRIPTRAALVEDMGWREQHTATAGPSEQEGLAPENREGELWELYRRMLQDGWHLDANGYSTSFRVKSGQGGKTLNDLEALLAALPASLASSMNLGTTDIYPATSGKANAGLYLLDRFDASPKQSCLLCDDDNDTELALKVGRAFVVGTTHDSMKHTAETHPDTFTMSTTGSILATEETLLKVGDFLGTYTLG